MGVAGPVLLALLPVLLFAVVALLAKLPVMYLEHDARMCDTCGYDLRGLDVRPGATVCPECGSRPRGVQMYISRPSAVTWRKLRAPLGVLVMFTLTLLLPMSVFGDVLDAIGIRRLGYSWSVAWKVANDEPDPVSVLVMLPLTAFMILSPGLFRREQEGMGSYFTGLAIVGIPTGILVLASAAPL